MSNRAVDGDEGAIQRTFKHRQTVVDVDDVDRDVDRTGQRSMDGRVTCCHRQVMDRLTLAVQRSVIIINY